MNEGVFPSQPIATQLVAELQLVMIRIVRTREKTAVRVSDSFPEHEVICAEGSDPGELVQEVTFQHQSSNDPPGLFPQYPWNFGENVDGGKFFSGKIPSNWRRYSAGGEWFFGVACFEPLRWYWSTLTWPESQDPQSISWLELALDFHASTHCALNMPDQTQCAATAFTMGRFFEYTSKRMGKICHAPFLPGQAVDHVSSLRIDVASKSICTKYSVFFDSDLVEIQAVLDSALQGDTRFVSQHCLNGDVW